MSRVVLAKPLKNGYWKVKEEYLDRLKHQEKELIEALENRSMLLREYEVWLFQSGKIRVVDLDWHIEFLKQRKVKGIGGDE